MDKQALARASVDVMWAGDRASQWLGMKIEEVRPGYARLSMRVTRDMVNGLGTCHGGIIFMLADSSFGYACNSHNQHAAAVGCTVDYLAPARAGDALVATAAEQARSGRTGVYDVRVENQAGTLIATFRGKSATVKGHWVEFPGEGT
jgi:acyl-CoA thioesterase